MEMRYSPAAAKKLWSYLRAAFFMVRKGLLSKRKLLVDLHLFLKRSRLLRRNLGSLLSHHHHHHHRPRGYTEYEFSCSNTPTYPVFFHGRRGRLHYYFPCLGKLVDEPGVIPRLTAPAAMELPRIEYSPEWAVVLSQQELAPGENRSPRSSPVSVRTSSYWSEEEQEDEGGAANYKEEVDEEAEEFIRRFYEQLRAQNRMALLEYQEREYRARGM